MFKTKTENFEQIGNLDGAVYNKVSHGRRLNMKNIIPNRDARRLFIYLHGLSDPRDKTRVNGELSKLIESFGFVQIDSIKVLERAHHHILFSRYRSYKRDWLKVQLEKERTLFENWTHDASIIPTAFFPYWKLRFDRAYEKLTVSKWWQKRIGENADATCKRVLDHVAEHGPLRSRDIKFDCNQGRTSNENWWGWNPTKAALVFLWRTGKLAVSGRHNFEKIYDLTTNVIPRQFLEFNPSLEEYTRWQCASALERIGFGSHTEIARYWNGITPGEAKTWCLASEGSCVTEIEIEDAEGNFFKSWAKPDIFDRLGDAPEAPNRIRFLSPFDPMIRDRKRTKRLFGFDFKIEIFVPDKKREFGYYVCPVLEKDKFIARIELKTDFPRKCLVVEGFWLEADIQLTKTRKISIEAELMRWMKFMGLNKVEWRI